MYKKFFSKHLDATLLDRLFRRTSFLTHRGTVDMDLGIKSELGRALNNVREMRGEWNEILRGSTVFALKVGIPVSSFIEKRTIKVRRFF